MKTKEKLKENKHLSTAILAVFVAGAIFYAGISFEQSRQIPTPPANQECLAYGEKVVPALKADIDKQFGIETPEGTPSQKEVSKHKENCLETVNKYEFVIQGDQ